jgi:ATP-dependent RNA helicase SUPV3L1/SUV3
MIDWSTVGTDQGRFTLHEDGQITWQVDNTNPLPGEKVAMVAKGETVLSPQVTLVDNAVSTSEAQARILKWLYSYIEEVLSPLFKLVDETENKLEGAAKEIGTRVYDHLGVIHRSEIEEFVPELTPELRASLRHNKVKMGPILVFMYELVKPAAINLRALLWGLWHGRSLPMDRPADGRVSVQINPEEIDRHYFRSIGYPVFGNLCIRIDMLDRVVTDIYDSSKDFKFQAKQQYMEWLGCGEEDLYAVLQSMGFRKLDEDKAEKTPEDAEKLEENDKKEEIKPELAIFLLKKGKISERPKPKEQKKSEKKPHKPKKKPEKYQNKAKIYSLGADSKNNEDDSPFSVLKTLKE